MLTDTTLKSAVDALWDKLWSGGLANPLDAIEQLSFLLFLKRLDEREQDAERAAKLRGKPFIPIFPSAELRWSHWTQLSAEKALKHVKETVFPFIKTLGGTGGSFADQMENAEFKLNKPSLLIEACRAIDAMQISAQNQDVQGDLYEYLLSKLNTAGTNGQFRTPRHIIRMMVKMRDPRPGERICDPAAGTCGFLVNAWQHLLETHTDHRDITYDEEGYPHGLTGSQLTKDEYTFSQTSALTGFDSDSGMTMLRIGSMNLMLHGIPAPNFRYTDALSKAFTEERAYDVVLANPPFKGAIDAGDVNPHSSGQVQEDGDPFPPPFPAPAREWRPCRRHRSRRCVVRLLQRPRRHPQKADRTEPSGGSRVDAFGYLPPLRRCLHGGAPLHQRRNNGEDLVLRYGA
jgi:type I restriction enzyme M protein